MTMNLKSSSRQMKSMQTSLIILGLCCISAVYGIASPMRQCVVGESENRELAGDSIRATPALRPQISFCEIFTPCVELSIPDSVVYALVDKEFDSFRPCFFVIEMSFDSTNTVRWARVLPVVTSRESCGDTAVAMMQRHVQQYLRDIIAKSKLRKDVRLSGAFEHTPIGDRFRERPVFGQIRYFFLEIMTSSDWIHASFGGNPDYNSFRYFVRW